ncbi:hypothetical protein SAMN06295967_101391 [Belliella buryatensis]|uniref:TolB-like 6-blade propeller-like n=1 Tax=Belliella buryatensis TaxID=1500549 RepID=A0A239AUM2_9BACT|nr:hypothetical protein [Belliella buryatensis]SNR99041.1 hypothetical protein SAMN06295967_101391 [Belliella buryatensis]
MRNVFLIGLIIMTLGVGCGQKDTKEASSSDYYYDLEIVDSLSIDYLGEMYLLSIDAENDLFLFMGSKFDQLMLVNRQGEIISEYNKPTDAPDSFGNLAMGGSVYNGKIAIMGLRKFNIYDLEFNLLETFEKDNLVSISMIYLGYEHLQPVEIDGQIHYVSYSAGPQTTYESNDPNYYLEYNNFEFINTATKTFETIVPFHERSLFYQPKIAYNQIKPWFQVVGKEIHYVHNTDSMYYRYDIKNPENHFAEQIPFDEFILPKGFEFGKEESENSQKDRPGNVSNIFVHDGQSLILYRSGLKEYEIPEKTDDNTENWKRILEKDKLKLIVRENDGSYSAPSTISSKLTLQSFDKKGRLWVKPNSFFLDFEPDMVTFYEMKLVKREKE